MMKEIITTIQNLTKKPLSLDDLQLMAWHELLKNDTITEYIVSDDGEILNLAEVQAKQFQHFSESLQNLSQGFAEMGKYMEGVGIELQKSLGGLAQIRPHKAILSVRREDNGSDRSNGT